MREQWEQREQPAVLDFLDSLDIQGQLDLLVLPASSAPLDQSVLLERVDRLGLLGTQDSQDLPVWLELPVL